MDDILINFIKELFKKQPAIEIVEFPEGKYAIRYNSKFGEPKYRDLSSPGFTWTDKDGYMADCMGTLERVKHVYALKHGGTGIKTHKPEDIL